jgi:hypothetical protein
VSDTLLEELPTIERDGMLLVVDDQRMRLTLDDVITQRHVRFRKSAATR